MLTTRKKRPLDRKEKPRRDASLIVVATEGSHTEKIYFDEFGSVKLKVKTLPSEDGKSSPNYILDNLRMYESEYQIGKGDQLWLVIDVDSWKISNLKAVAAKCRKNKYGLAISNPCFELWLALHFDEDLPLNISARFLEKHLKTHLGGFNKSRYDASRLKNGIPTAIEKARKMNTAPNDRWPQQVGTHVYKLVEAIVSKL